MRAKLILTTAISALMAFAPLQTAAAQEIARERDPAAQVSVTERPRPEYDPLGLRLGGFDLHASLGVGVASTDNELATDLNKQDDVITSITPQASLTSHWSRHAVALRAGAYSENHSDFDQDNIDNYYVGADGRLDVLRSGEVGAGASFNREHEQRADPDSPTGIAEPVEYDRTNAYLYARQTFNRLRLTGRVEQAKYDYKDVPSNTPSIIIDQDNRDHDETVESIRAEFAVTPRLGVLVDAAANQRDYDQSSLRDSDGSTYGVGVSFNITDLLRGEALVTRFEQKYDDPAIGTVDGTGFAGHLEWFPTQLTTVNADASRTVEDSAFAGGEYVLSQAGAGVDHELRRNIILHAGVRFAKREYENIDRDDDFAGADIGATYIANRRVRFNLGYSYRQNDSSGTDPSVFGQDFEENRLTAGVSFHL